MGDEARFDRFADYIAKRIETDVRIADVAAGNGLLRRALLRRGYRCVDSFDKRPRRQKNNVVKGLFHWKEAPGNYDTVIGMHPDEATDHIVLFAIRWKIPFIICPCCIKPSAMSYKPKTYDNWVSYLQQIGESAGMRVARSYLSIKGCNVVLFGQP